MDSNWGWIKCPVTKNVLTEFVGSTNCPYCPEADALLLSYFNTEHENYVGNSITSNWFLINYHTYSPGRGDPMYEFHRGLLLKKIFVMFVLKKVVGILFMAFLLHLQTEQQAQFILKWHHL